MAADDIDRLGIAKLLRIPSLWFFWSCNCKAVAASCGVSLYQWSPEVKGVKFYKAGLICEVLPNKVKEMNKAGLIEVRLKNHTTRFV